MQVAEIREIKGINKNMRPADSAGLIFFLFEIAKESKVISKNAKIIIPGGNNIDSISFLMKNIYFLFFITVITFYLRVQYVISNPVLPNKISIDSKLSPINQSKFFQ
jgi:hypothetical protein